MKKLLIATNSANVLGKSVYTIGLGLMVVLILSKCGTAPTTTEDNTVPQLITDTVDIRYIAEDLTGNACWYSAHGRDSLVVEGKKYVISSRSRYRKFEEPADFGDTLAEGPVALNEPITFLHDTKTGLNYVFNYCKQ